MWRGAGQPQRVMDAGRKFGRDGARVGLAFRRRSRQAGPKLVEVLLRTLNTEGGSVHAVLQVSDLGSASSTRGVGSPASSASAKSSLPL